jgi:hypothetical protein
MPHSSFLVGVIRGCPAFVLGPLVWSSSRGLNRLASSKLRMARGGTANLSLWSC